MYILLAFPSMKPSSAYRIFEQFDISSDLILAQLVGSPANIRTLKVKWTKAGKSGLCYYCLID